MPELWSEKNLPTFSKRPKRKKASSDFIPTSSQLNKGPIFHYSSLKWRMEPVKLIRHKTKSQHIDTVHGIPFSNIDLACLLSSSNTQIYYRESTFNNGLKSLYLGHELDFYNNGSTCYPPQLHPLIPTQLRAVKSSTLLIVDIT